MVRSVHLTVGLFAGSFVLTQSALSQSLGTGSISGYVLSEEGRTVRASVTLSFAAARGYPSPPRRMFTGTNGAFTFSRLPAGRYVLCAQVAASEPAPANSPYVDTCLALGTNAHHAGRRTAGRRRSIHCAEGRLAPGSRSGPGPCPAAGRVR
jgi:hypothetical protein